MPRRPRSSRCADDRGSATAETAIVLPVVVLMVLVVLATGAGLGTQVKLENAARAAAREMARGEDRTAAAATAERVGGEGTRVHITLDGAWVRVDVTRTLSMDSGALSGASWELSADAESRREPHLIEGGPP